MSQTAKGRVLAFLVILVLLSVAADVLISRGTFGRAGSLAYMWCPGLAAFIASIIIKRPFSAIGWRLPKLKWLAAGWLIPLGYALIAYGLVWITGLGEIPKETFLPRARLTLNLPTQPDWLVYVVAFAFITIVSLLPSMVSALGEEIGWRGYLVPELTNWIGFRGACLVSGAVWAAWHLPAVLWHGYGVAGTPKAFQVACFVAMVITSAVVLAWLRMKSASLWPAAIMHATHNAAIQMFFDPITAHKQYTQYFVGEFGLALLLPLVALAWFIMRRGIASSNERGQKRS